MMASRAAQSQLLTGWGGALFLIGKIIRFLIFFVFLFVVSGSSGSVISYSREQVIIFYLIFNLTEILSQFLFRGAYWFRSLVVSGDYDLDLLKPLPSFFRPVFGWTDILDLFTLIPLIIYLFLYVSDNSYSLGNLNIFLFLVLLINSLVIAFSFHLMICGVCVLTTEIDSLILAYRDISSMARFPTDIYSKEVQLILTFVIPIVILVTIPAKALMSLVSWQWTVLSLLVGVIFLFVSLTFWQYVLKRYSSASS